MLYAGWHLWQGLDAVTRALLVLGQEHEAHQKWTGVLSSRLTLMDQTPPHSSESAPRLPRAHSPSASTPSQFGMGGIFYSHPDPRRALRVQRSQSQLSLTPPPPQSPTRYFPVSDSNPPSPFPLPARRFRDISLSDWSQPALSVTSRSPIHWESVMELAESIRLPEGSPPVGVDLEELRSECSLNQPSLTRSPLLPRYCPLGLEIPPPRLEWLVSQGLREPHDPNPCPHDTESEV